jgi:CheY-like chemotaxis protein
LNQVIVRAEQSIAELLRLQLSVQFSLSPNVRHVAVPADLLEQIVLGLCRAANGLLGSDARLLIETRGMNDAPIEAEPSTAYSGEVLARVLVRAERVGHSPAMFVPSHPGLGLLDLEQLLERSGGRLEFVLLSENEFAYVAHLPYALAAQSSGRIALPALAEAGVILLIEDEPQVQAVTARILRAFGYGVITAHNERTAMAHAEAYGAAIGLVVSDLVLPGVSGKELVRRLRAPCQNARVLYVSGYSPDYVGALTDGACFLRKPYTAQELLAAVRELLPESAD